MNRSTSSRPPLALGLHSHFSLMEATPDPASLCQRVRELGYQRLAVCDVNNLYGLWPLLASCQAEGLTPLIGAELRWPLAGQDREPSAQERCFCLVKDTLGFSNLCQLLSARHCEPQFKAPEALGRFHQGLIILSRSTSLLQHLAELGADAGAALLSSQEPLCRTLFQQAKKLGLPGVPLLDSFFLSPQDHFLHQLLRAMASNSSLSRLDQRVCAPARAYLPGPAELVHRFQLWPHCLKELERISERCSFTGPSQELIMPPWPLEAGLNGPQQQQDPQAADQELARQAREGARYRYGTPLPQAVTRRLAHELGIIAQMNFSSYFLVVREIVGPVARTCGRGSGAASLVSYCLGITNVCPIKHSLYFERFLNPGRKDPPDIDVDFSWDERDAILNKLLERFGAQAAMVCNQVRLQPRMVIREVAKVWGLPGGEISRLSKRLPWLWQLNEQEDLLSRLKNLPQLRGVELHEPWPRILQLAQRLSSTPSHLSVHPGGVIITPKPVASYVPVERAAKGVPIIQWDKDGAEEAGLVKIDLLGNRSLGVIRDTVEQVRKEQPFQEQGWQPEDDPATQATIAQGRTMGCFYIESPATRLLQRKARTGDFDHLVIHSSIIRPAANTFIREYLRRLHGGDWQPLHPLVGRVLDESYGIMVYQEDVSRVAVQFGFSHVEADGLRKIMSKKDRQRKLKDFEQRFLSMAEARQVPTRVSRQIWEMMMSFEGYSFCKPHSASYAQVSFQAAFLKTHFPAQFMAAVISNQGGFYSTFAYLSEARRLGLTILPPDVAESEIHWRGQGDSLRVGLMAIRGLSLETAETIVRERQLRPFKNMADFLERIRPHQDQGLALIHCGALDRLNPEQEGKNRGVLCWLLAHWLQTSRSKAPLLFAPTVKPPPLPPEDLRERLRREYRVLGFLCSCHPISLYQETRRRLSTILARDLSRHRPRTGQPPRQIRFLGWLITAKVVTTRKGQPMEFVSFEDETGQVECTFFPRTYQRYCHLLDGHGPLLLEGTVDEEFGVCTLTVERLADRRNSFQLQSAGLPLDTFSQEP
ncbi:DNA polymerase III subunit alpha [Desulfogranum mediterraneum]|uniref:DNA polymerase III subunit alpha n=1 Tax=Desulfogranum mediterraneum TaxID=160661 RepID=UPI00040CFD1A|nr:DNA polymerase III subunit alpha [Desulfogranum mediterraneum]